MRSRATSLFNIFLRLHRYSRDNGCDLAVAKARAATMTTVATRGRYARRAQILYSDRAKFDAGDTAKK